MNLHADVNRFLADLHKARDALKSFVTTCHKCGGTLRVRNTIHGKDSVRRYRVCDRCGFVRRTEEK